MDLNEINFHYNTMAINATRSNWRDVVESLIGEEEVEFKPQDLNRKTPLIRIWAKNKEAVNRVMTNAALVD